MPAATQASATSMMGIPTMPKTMVMSRERRVCAISCAPVGGSDFEMERELILTKVSMNGLMHYVIHDM